VDVRVPKRVETSRARLLANGLLSVLLLPLYWWLAGLRRVPGLGFRAKCFFLGLSLLVRPRVTGARREGLRLVLMPMDSTRYFEFDFAERAMADLQANRYLDVSSPRMVPIMFARSRPGLRVDMINPDSRDLADSLLLVRAAGLDRRFTLRGCTVADAPFDPGTFDIVTCISVLEHIPDDTEALRVIWSRMSPGGTLVLTVPCMAVACEQYIDHDEYRLLPADDRGFVFWQRFYDVASLEQRIFSVLGRPCRSEVYGEKVAGSFARNAEQKRRLGASYPFWREPYMMSRDYRRFASIRDLPGDGVVGMTFVK
jgi:SAM-dependent methyltransferase